MRAYKITFCKTIFLVFFKDPVLTSMHCARRAIGGLTWQPGCWTPGNDSKEAFQQNLMLMTSIQNKLLQLLQWRPLHLQKSWWRQHLDLQWSPKQQKTCRSRLNIVFTQHVPLGLLSWHSYQRRCVFFTQFIIRGVLWEWDTFLKALFVDFLLSSSALLSSEFLSWEFNKGSGFLH